MLERSNYQAAGGLPSCYRQDQRDEGISWVVAVLICIWTPFCHEWKAFDTFLRAKECWRDDGFSEQVLRCTMSDGGLLCSYNGIGKDISAYFLASVLCGMQNDEGFVIDSLSGEVFVGEVPSPESDMA